MAARKRFTKRLHSKLAAYLAGVMKKEGLALAVDEKPFVGWPGRPDVALVLDDDESDGSVVVLELEHWSGQQQANKNILQAIEWTRELKDANVAFVHIVNTRGNVDPDELVRVAAQCRSKRWKYSQIRYAHDRNDMDSTTDDYIAMLLSKKPMSVIWEAVDFVFE